jgi:hypothetical protein
MISATCIPQAEVVIQFMMGTLNISDTYCDDAGKIAYKYVTAPAGFWLDVITSLPWSFNDLYSSQVQLLCMFHNLHAKHTHTDCCSRVGKH